MMKNTLLILIIFILIFLVLRYKYNEYARRRKLRKQFKRGNELEKEAQYFLEKKGYKVLEAQYECYHYYKVDGKEYKSKLIIDYVVSRKSKVYLVEVKSGKKAISISDKNTRRQILEYYFAIENDGVFLLDMENENLQKIEFAAKDQGDYKLWVTISVLLGLLSIGLIIEMFIE